MIRDDLAQLVASALKKAQRKNDLPKFEIPPVPMERPKQAEHGDFATPVCLQLARHARMAPRDIARKVVKRLAKTDYVGQVEIAAPGYINFTLDEGWLARQVETILAAGEAFGNVDVGQGKRVQVEYISANPTGSLTVGSGRNAVLGDGLANVLAAAGYDVQREYYVNDAGTQMEHFGATIYFDRIMSILRQGNHLYEKDGAVWFNARDLGGDKDEVVIRSTGRPGYFASDIAYHYHKFVVRDFEWVINVWGAGHQGHVPRMKAMMRALELDPDRLTLLIYQMVTILRDGQLVRMGKRLGTAIDLAEVLDEIGPDAVRFFLLSRSADSQMELDLELAKRQSGENPVYYVQYAHARIASILRHAAEVGVEVKDGDVSLLTHPSELALIRKMLYLPEVIEAAALQLAPHHLTYYAQDLAAAFHIFYRDCRVVSSDPADAAITQARLKLASPVLPTWFFIPLVEREVRIAIQLEAFTPLKEAARKYGVPVKTLTRLARDGETSPCAGQQISASQSLPTRSCPSAALQPTLGQSARW